MNEKREVRNTASPVDIPVEESRAVEGYALLFDTPSDGLSFEEVIERGALDGVIERSDVLALLNHSTQRGVLARSRNGNGSLVLTVDQKGLRYRFDAPRTALGDELLENLRRGDVAESSFAFTVAEDAWERKEDGSWRRTIRKFDELFDVSPVYNAAYSATSVYTRGREAEEARLHAEQSANLEKYYDTITQSLNI